MYPKNSYADLSNQESMTPQMESCQAQGAPLGGYKNPYRPDPLAEMEKRNAQIEQEHAQRAQGIAFLRENPQFARFIELIRLGSISI